MEEYKRKGDHQGAKAELGFITFKWDRVMVVRAW